MQPDPHLVTVFNYYRDAEMRGATLLIRLCNMTGPGDVQTALSRHICDETRHAWLWTKRIMDIGGVVVPLDDGYQRRIGRVGLPRTIFDIFALTVVVEQRALTRYNEHLARPDVDADTRKTLEDVSKDEHWHIGWMESAAKEMARAKGDEKLYDIAIAKYRVIDDEVTIELNKFESGTFGFSFSHPFKPEDIEIARHYREKGARTMQDERNSEPPGVRAAAAAALGGI
ncbi:MAG: ferritin-like domain-containing protein [Planctomycetes bacterium]|nr:ferritin-like domain-containing protein [Planctomycetota bacterium]